MSYRKLALENWKREQQYHFFKEYEDPFFGIAANVEVTNMHQYVKDTKSSFFLASLYVSLKAANELEAFRYRIREDDVIVHDTVHAGSTVMQDDETFGFCYFGYEADAGFQAFQKKGKQNIAQQNASKALDPKLESDDLIYYSVIPWVSFTTFKHAKNYRKYDSIPRIVFGKFFEDKGKIMLPLSVEVNHALMDGLHVGRYFEHFEAIAAESDHIFK